MRRQAQVHVMRDHMDLRAPKSTNSIGIIALIGDDHGHQLRVSSGIPQSWAPSVWGEANLSLSHEIAPPLFPVPLESHFAKYSQATLHCLSG
jgi:hypothetical protein